MAAATIDDARALGYTAELASGSVQAEEAALEDARAHATAAAIDADAAPIIDQATRAFLEIVRGDPAWTPERRRDHLARLQEQTYRMLEAGRAEAVAHAERAVKIAGEIPDVWAVSGPTIGNVYVSTKPDGTGWTDGDQELLDALVHPDAHAERVFQEAAGPATVAVVGALRDLLGGDVSVAAADGVWSVHVDGQTVESHDELVELLPEDRRPRP